MFHNLHVILSTSVSNLMDIMLHGFSNQCYKCDQNGYFINDCMDLAINVINVIKMDILSTIV